MFQLYNHILFLNIRILHHGLSKAFYIEIIPITMFDNKSENEGTGQKILTISEKYIEICAMNKGSSCPLLSIFNALRVYKINRKKLPCYICSRISCNINCICCSSNSKYFKGKDMIQITPMLHIAWYLGTPKDFISIMNTLIIYTKEITSFEVFQIPNNY